MANVLFCSDLHLDHKRIGKFREPLGITSPEANNTLVYDTWKALVKQDEDYSSKLEKVLEAIAGMEKDLLK